MTTLNFSIVSYRIVSLASTPAILEAKSNRNRDFCSIPNRNWSSGWNPISSQH